MTVYPTYTKSTSPYWQESIESTWQLLPPSEARDPGWKRPDLGLSDRLFIGAVVNLPKHQREWGVIDWLADVYQTSRPTLYAIGSRTKTGLLAPPRHSGARAQKQPAVVNPETTKTVRVTRNRMIRTALCQ